MDANKLQKANTLLLLADWMATTGEGLHDDIVSKYEQAFELAGGFERTHFRAACYWDSLLVDVERRYLRSSLQCDTKELPPNTPSDQVALDAFNSNLLFCS